MEALSVEELALQRIFDLKNEVALEFESHQQLFDEALLSNVFLKGLDPPPWLSINGNRGEKPILLSRRPSFSVFRIGSDGKRVHRQDSVSRDFSKQGQLSELYADFFCNRKRGSSSVDRPSFHEAVATKKRRVEESGFVGSRETDGDRGKDPGLDAVEEEKGEEQGFGDAQHGEREQRRDMDDVHHGGNEGGQGLFDAQQGRNEENNGSQEEDVKDVEKKAKGRPRGRGAKEKKNNLVSPFVGRITRSRAKQCQVLPSAKKDIDKRISAVRSKQPRGTRKNARAKGAGGLEVSAEPKDVIEVSSSAAVAEPQVGGKSSPLMNVFGIEDQLPELPMKTEPQIRNKSSPVLAESQVEAKLSPAMTQLQNEDHSSPVMNHLQIEDTARRDDIGRTEGITAKTSEVKSASMEPGCGGSKDIDHKSAQQEDTSEMAERCIGEVVPRDDCRRSAGSCDAEQLEASNVTETARKESPNAIENVQPHFRRSAGSCDAEQLEVSNVTETAKETPNVIENVQLHEISDLSESTQLKLTEEKHPVVFQNQLKGNSSPVEEGAKGEVPSVLRPFENQKNMDTMPIDTTLVSNITCPAQEMGASRCHETFSGKVDLLADNLKSTPPLVQEIPSNPRYSCKSGLPDASQPPRRTYVLEKLVFSDKGSHPISDNVNLLGNGLVQEVPDSPLLGNGLVQEVPESPSIEGTGHKLSMKANASDMTVMDVLFRNEREDTDAIGTGSGQVSICPDGTIPSNGLGQAVPESPLLGNGLGWLAQEVPDSPSIERTGHKLSMKANVSDMTVMDALFINEREDTDVIGKGPGKVSICPNGKTPSNGLVQAVPGSPLLGNGSVQAVPGSPLFGNGVVQEVLNSPSIEEAGHKSSMKGNGSDMTVTDVPLRSEGEDTDAIGIGLGKISICPNGKISDQDEPDTALYEERDKYEKASSYSNVGFIHGRTLSFHLAQGLSCDNLHKSESDITEDLTNKLRNRSIDFCKKTLGKETSNCSNIVMNVGGQDCLKAVSFSRFRSLSGSSVKLPSQGNEGQNPKRARSASPVDVNGNIPSGGEENKMLPMPEDMDFMTKKVDEPFVHSQKSWDSRGKVGTSDSVLAIFSQDEAVKEQFETLHHGPSNKRLDVDIDFMDRTLPGIAKLFSRSTVEVKEEGHMKLQHSSWPKYQKINSQVQQQFHSAGQSRLWRTESCSKILDYDTSTRLLNGGIEATSNDVGDIFQCDGVAKPCASNSERNGDMENSEPRHDPIVNIHLLKDFSSLGSNSSEAFPDQQNENFMSSQIKINKDVEQSLGDSEHQHRAKLILEECSARMGHYPRQSFTDLGEAKCGNGNENVRRRSPLCLSYSTTNEGAFGYTGLSQVRVDGMHFQATNNNTPLACLQGQAHCRAAPLKLCSFRSSFEVMSPQNHGTEGDCKLLPGDDTVSDFTFQKGLSGMENNDMESTPLLKGGVFRERAQCSQAKSLLVNQKPLSQLKLAGLESDEVDVSVSELSQRKKSPSLEVDCQPKVNSSINGFAKGAGGSPGMPHLAQPSCSFSSTNQTVDSVASDKLFQSTQLGSLHDVKMLQEFEGFNNGLFSKDKNSSSENGNEWVGIDMEYEGIGDENGKYSSMKEGVKATEFCKAFRSLTPAPNHILKCRTLMPLNICPSYAMGLEEHKESPGEYRGKRYAMNDSYMAAHGLPTDKFQTRSGFSGVVGYGTTSKNSPSSTTAGGTFFERMSKNSMEMDSSSFLNKVQMIKGHAECFRIEEESGIEEESMDHPISMKHSKKRFGSSTKKSVLGTKKMRMDSSSAKQNSPLATPAGGKFFERISTNYTDTGSNLLSKKSYMNQNFANCFNNEEEVGFEKENREPSVSVSELRKNCDSSVKKKVLRNRNTQAYSSNGSHISPAKSNQKSNNLLSNVRSFIPLVQQKPAAASIMTGKRDVKVKALEAAEAAKRLEEKREQERKMRKELARRGEHEKYFQEKPKEERYIGEREGEETTRASSDCSNKSTLNGVVRKKPVGCALPKSHAENSSQFDTSAYGVDLKLKRALEAKTKLEQEKVKKLEEERRRKEEERKKKEAELAAKKRKREEIERRDREEKRKRLEEVQRQQKEIEEQLRADKEVKEQRRRALDEHERKRKAMEEEAKKQRRIEKEKEAAERRRRIEEDAKASKFTLKDAKHLEETHQQHEAILQVHKANAEKVSSMCNNFSKSRQHETEGKLMQGINEKLLQSTEPDINIQSYEISPYKGSDEEDDDEDAAPGKFIPLWARKENLIQHLTRQQYIDPDEIFTGAKTCSLNEVFGTNGSLRRTDFSRRSKSGEWLADKFTWKEEYQYKLQMGYINKG